MFVVRPPHTHLPGVRRRPLSSEAGSPTPTILPAGHDEGHGLPKAAPSGAALNAAGVVPPPAPQRQQPSRQSILVEPAVEYPHKAETRRSKQRHYKSVSQQLMLDAIRMAGRKPLPNWRLVLQYLTAWTPEHTTSDWQVDALKIVLPQEAATVMLSGVDNNIWAINRRTGCAMKLYQGVGPDGSTSVVLSGSQASLNKATEAILQVAQKATVIHLPNGALDMASEGEPTTSADEQPASDRAVVSTPGRSPHLEGVDRPYRVQTSVRDIAKPAEWTQASFEHYVASITNARLPPDLVSKAYSGGTERDKTVVSLLHDAFNDEAARPSLSLSAFKRALAFMSKKGPSYRPDARALFVRMESCGISMDTEVFNILLESAVRVQDLRSFDSMLRLMVGRGHTPNVDTWIQFLRMVRNEDVKRYIIGAMASKGLLRERAVVGRVAQEMAPYDAHRAALEGKDLQAFLAEQDTRYGPDWLRTEAGNRVLEVLGRFGRFEDSFALLDVMSRGGRASRPDLVSYNTVLTHAEVQRRMLVAATVLRKMEEQPGPPVVPGGITYHLLFEMAWQHEHPTVVRVVWFYAVLARLTRFRMRQRMTALLGQVAGPDGSPAPGATPAATAKKPSKLQSLASVAAPGGDGAHGLVPGAGGAPAQLPKTGSQLNKLLKERFAGWEPDAPLGATFQAALERDLQARRLARESEEPARRRPLALRLRRRKDGPARGQRSPPGHGNAGEAVVAYEYQVVYI